MPGLMNGMEDEAGAAEAAGRKRLPPADETGANVSPEEQQQYEQFIDLSQQLAYDKSMLPKILDRFRGDGDQVDELANVAAMVVIATEDRAKAKGMQFAPDIVLHAGEEIVADLANLAAEAKIQTYDQKQIEAAFLRGVDVYRSLRQSAGQVDRKAAQDDMRAMVQAERSGGQGQMNPGADAAGGDVEG